MKLPSDVPGARLQCEGPVPYLQIDRGGCHQAEDNWQGVYMAHPSLGFYYCDEAGMWAEDSEGQVWHYASEAITMIPPWFAYTYHFKPGMMHAYVHVTVPTWPDALLRQVWTSPQILHDPHLRLLFQIYAKLVATQAAASAQQMAAMHLGYACLQALLAADQHAQDVLLNGDRPWQHLGPALDLVEAALHRPLAVGELAAALHISREYCSRLFLKHLKQSPVHYIQERRVARAMALLRSSTDSLDDIAEACGCGSRQHLNRIFRRHTHASPSDWRGR